MKRGKKYVEAAKLVDRATLYDVNEAVSIVKKASSAKFDETVEAHIRTGCDMSFNCFVKFCYCRLLYKSNCICSFI